MSTEAPRRNIELKARCPDPAAVRAAALALPAREATVMRQVDTYFAVPRGRLKLREIGGQQAELIFYERPNERGSRCSEYRLLPVSEPALLLAVLTAALGVRARVEKDRCLLLFRHTRIHLDSVAGLGEFIELETVLEGLTDEQGRAECAEVAAALGIRAEDLLDGSYGEMVVRFPESVPTF